MIIIIIIMVMMVMIIAAVDTHQAFEERLFRHRALLFHLTPTIRIPVSIIKSDILILIKSKCIKHE